MSEVHHTTETAQDLLSINIHCVICSLWELNKTAVTTLRRAPFFFSVNDPISLTNEITSVVLDKSGITMT
jgi:hypothetical protein